MTNPAGYASNRFMLADITKLKLESENFKFACLIDTSESEPVR